MNYKALFLDVDGTVVPYDYAALPSEKLTRALQEAQNHVTVSFVTGRSYHALKPVLNRIGLSQGYAVVDNGAHVVNIATDDVLYDRPIEKITAHRVMELLEQEGITYYVKQGTSDTTYLEKPFQKHLPLQKAAMIFSDETYTSEKIDHIQKLLSGISDINVYKTRHKHGYGLNIQHVNATKLHGVEVILKKLNLNRKHAIGVGDSYNDFPLLMACGLKVAMGNAVEDLKVIADFVAPPVEKDGVATVINKFIFNEI